jgi:hypothetical protein
LDDLVGGSAQDATYNHTRTAIRSFNFFWQHHPFNESTEPSLYGLKSKYGDFFDGFQALCTASHSERNIMLAHFVTKMIKRIDTDDSGVTFVKGRTKHGYLNSLQRGMHLYEHEHQLTEQYGDWTWTKSPFYAKTKAQLQEITVCNEIAVSPSKLDKSADYLTDEQFDALHEHTWKLGEDLNLPFSQRILHKQAYFIQGTALFECLRGRDEIANCLI